MTDTPFNPDDALDPLASLPGELAALKEAGLYRQRRNLQTPCGPLAQRDDLPGPPWLRGKALEKRTQHLIDTYPPPAPGNVALWRNESHALLAVAYPEKAGSLLPIITDEFNRQAHEIANQRIVAAGYRLGWLLEAAITARVSRETQ